MTLAPCGHPEPAPAACDWCRRAVADPRYRCLWWGQACEETSSPSPSRTSLPCIHLGPDTGKTVNCSSCSGNVSLKLLACGVHDSCTPHKKAPGVACCQGCPDHKPDTFSLVAPLGCRDRPRPWEGRTPIKPWQYGCSLAIPHFAFEVAQLEPLKVALALWQTQTLRPFLLVVDTGSTPQVMAELRKLETDDLEVTEIRGRGYRHSSEPVSLAMDYAFARSLTPLLFATHQDVFPVRRDLLAWYADQCTPSRPCVGYRMSPRQGTDLWKICPGHSATMFHVPTLKKLGINWDIQEAYATLGISHPTNSWPDTESNIGLGLRRCGLAPHFIGDEVNHRMFEDKNIIHARSLPAGRLYADPDYVRKAETWLAGKTIEAKKRLLEWGGVLPS